MPCFRCSARQTDPVRGESLWHRAVIGGEQVLICPTCQRSTEWAGALDRCDRCASTRLAKALGTVLCRDCGARTDTRPSAAGAGAAAPELPGPRTPTPETGGQPTTTGLHNDNLAADVEAALARMFGRPRPVS